MRPGREAFGTRVSGFGGFAEFGGFAGFGGLSGRRAAAKSMEARKTFVAGFAGSPSKGGIGDVEGDGRRPPGGPETVSCPLVSGESGVGPSGERSGPAPVPELTLESAAQQGPFCDRGRGGRAGASAGFVRFAWFDRFGCAGCKSGGGWSARSVTLPMLWSHRSGLSLSWPTAWSTSSGLCVGEARSYWYDPFPKIWTRLSLSAMAAVLRWRRIGRVSGRERMESSSRGVGFAAGWAGGGFGCAEWIEG